MPETTTYTYDARDRLKTVTYGPDEAYAEGRIVTYGYDEVGNRTSELTTHPTTGAVLASKAGTFDPLNRLTLLADGLDSTATITFAYDDNGNQTAKTVAGATTAFRYDVRDKLVEVETPTVIAARFQHDADGRLVKKIGEDGIRQYVYDEDSRFLEYDTAGLQIAKYSYGADRLISLIRADEGTRFYHLDGLGSVTALTDPTGAVTSRLHLDAWGVFRNPLEMNGPGASKNRFAFTGYVFDRETELYFAKARFYDPTVGRFTSQDSFLGDIDAPPSLHRYFYAHANPVRYVDPTGHCVALPGICEAAVRQFVGMTRDVNFAGSTSGSTAGKLLNFGLHAGIESVGNALTLPQNAVMGAFDALTPGGFSYWGGNQVDTSYAPARAQQVAALDAAADPSRSFAERGLYGALSVLSTPVTVVESLTTAPGGRAAEHLGQSAHRAETAKTVDDYAFAQLEGLGDLVGAFNSYGALAAPFAPKLAAGTRAVSAPSSGPITDPRRTLPAPQDFNQWQAGAQLWAGPAPRGTTIEMAMSPGQVRPGGWGTTDVIPDVPYVRNELAVRAQFKPEIDAMQRFAVPEGVQIQYGPVGPQAAPEGFLPGGGTQVQILNFADRSKLVPVGPRLKIKE